MPTTFGRCRRAAKTLHAAQKESCNQETLMTAIEYISDAEEIIKASSSNFQNDGAAAVTMLE
jgi:hypothetical protein